MNVMVFFCCFTINHMYTPFCDSRVISHQPIQWVDKSARIETYDLPSITTIAAITSDLRKDHETKNRVPNQYTGQMPYCTMPQTFTVPKEFMIPSIELKTENIYQKPNYSPADRQVLMQHNIPMFVLPTVNAIETDPRYTFTVSQKSRTSDCTN